MSTNLPRFVMIGGFLGAGKTTTIAKLAKHYQSQGKKVGIVTNDQATDLVDTNLLRSQGFDVGEVAGSCFCCNFNALTDTVEQLGAGDRPDVIIAEPVGSCTDLVATVIRPLQQIYDQPFDIAPYGVIVKPSHGLKILKKVKRGGFSPQAEYIFRKQIEEADFVLLNRIDELSIDQVSELIQLIEADFPNMPCIRMSAKTGEGFDGLTEYLELRGEFGKRLMDVDYDVYAAGEAELGWLNAQLSVQSTKPFEIDSLLEDLVNQIQKQLQEEGSEVAHLKAIGMQDGQFAVVNLVSSDSNSVLSVPSRHAASSAELIVNARVATDPERLTKHVQDAIDSICGERGIRYELRTLQSFKPGRPVPTHRIHN